MDVIKVLSYLILSYLKLSIGLLIRDVVFIPSSLKWSSCDHNLTLKNDRSGRCALIKVWLRNSGVLEILLKI